MAEKIHDPSTVASFVTPVEGLLTNAEDEDEDRDSGEDEYDEIVECVREKNEEKRTKSIEKPAPPDPDDVQPEEWLLDPDYSPAYDSACCWDRVLTGIKEGAASIESPPDWNPQCFMPCKHAQNLMEMAMTSHMLVQRQIDIVWTRSHRVPKLSICVYTPFDPQTRKEGRKNTDLGGIRYALFYLLAHMEGVLTGPHWSFSLAIWIEWMVLLKAPEEERLAWCKYGIQRT